jgi:hypothetical protein
MKKIYLFIFSSYLALVALVIFLSNLAWAESPTNTFESYKAQIVCETLCLQDGDELGVIINKACYCANKRDTSAIVQRVMTKPQDRTRFEYPQVRY